MKRSFKNITFWILRLWLCLGLAFAPLPAGAQISLPATTILPPAGALVHLSGQYLPPIIRGMTLDPANPMRFEFIVNSGQDNVAGPDLRREGVKLIKYFLAALTVPEDQMWVNLSPYEPDRVIPPHFGLTEMGRDLLAQDYLLKQLTASLVYPEKDLGQEFWQAVYRQVREDLGAADIALNTFNKVWIVPDKAVVYEHENSVFILESRLKVMLEDDYFALLESRERKEPAVDRLSPEAADLVNRTAARAVREIIVPAIEKEINEGKTFAGLRQIYNSMILATWYKVNMRETILGRYYADQNKIAGIDLVDPNEPRDIYEKYLEAFRAGVFNFIREDYEPVDRQVLPRKYFSGGFDPSTLTNVLKNSAGSAGTVERGDRLSDLLVKEASDSEYLNIEVNMLELGKDKDGVNVDKIMFEQSSGRTPPDPVLIDITAGAATSGGDTYGGIDLNPEWLDLRVRRDGAGVPLPLSEQLLGDIQIEGVIPVIKSITPILDIRLLLGR
jgi:hypothetical protein